MTHFFHDIEKEPEALRKILLSVLGKNSPSYTQAAVKQLQNGTVGDQQISPAIIIRVNKG